MKKSLRILLGGMGVASVAAAILAIHKKRGPRAVDDLHNPFEGKRVKFVEDEHDPVNADGMRGHLVSIGESGKPRMGLYERVIKRGLDVILCACALVILSPVFLVISIAVYLDDPGVSPLFVQKRVGKDKKYFLLHKFRSMSASTPDNVPTHMLEDAESYITRVGAVLRRTSLDELVQIWDIFLGEMSIIGPRPALWNQDCLIALRDGSSGSCSQGIDANSVRPGLTGLAQIKGRDELELPEKAAMDREYVAVLRAGGVRAFVQDLKCFFGTVVSVFRHEGIVEGGTGNMI